MSLLERTRQIVPTVKSGPTTPKQVLAVAAGYGAVGALALTLVLIVPVLLAWLADPQSTASWLEAMSFAPDAWVLAHRGSLGVSDLGISVVAPPLLLTALAVLSARMACRASLAHLPSARTATGVVRALACFVAGYTLTGAVLALSAWVGPARPNPLIVLPGAALVATLGAGWALWRDHAKGTGVASPLFEALEERTPLLLIRAWRPAVVGAGVLAGIGLLLVLLAIVTSYSRVSSISSELGPGSMGLIVLTLGQLLAAPNLAFFAATWLSGASLSVGPVVVGHATVTPGVLPMVPVLGALPEAGAGPWWAPFVPFIPALVGCVVGHRALANLTSLASLRAKVQTAALAATLAGLLVFALALVGSMGVSGGSLDYIGPSLLALPLLLAELVLGAVLTAAALHYWRNHR